MTVSRTYGGRTFNVALKNNYVVSVKISESDLIEAISDTNTYIGNQIVGKVKKGERYTVTRVNGD